MLGKSNSLWTTITANFPWSFRHRHPRNALPLVVLQEIESFTDGKTHIKYGFVLFSGSGKVLSLANAASISVPMCILNVASPSSSTGTSHPSAPGTVSVSSLHHQFSDSVSPFQAVGSSALKASQGAHHTVAPEVNEQPPMARLTSSLGSATSLDSETRGVLKTEITKWIRRSPGVARSVDNMECSTFSHDSESTAPPVSTKFRAKTVLFISLVIALLRGESILKASERSSNTSGRRRERLADAHGSATPRPPESMRPAATLLGGTLRCGEQRRHCAGGGTKPATSLLSFPTASTAALVSVAASSTIRPRGLDFAASGSTVAASTSCSPPHASTDAPLKGLGVLELLDLTSNVQTASGHLRKNVYRNNNSRCQGRCGHQQSSPSVSRAFPKLPRLPSSIGRTCQQCTRCGSAPATAGKRRPTNASVSPSQSHQTRASSPFTKTTISAGAQKREHSTIKFALLTVPVTLILSQIGISSSGL